PPFTIVAHADFTSFDRISEARIDAGLRTRNQAVEVHDLARARAFVQVINILGDYGHLISPFQLYKCGMRRIWLSFQYRLSSDIVEMLHALRVAGPRLRCGHVLHAVPFPKSVTAPERF